MASGGNVADAGTAAGSGEAAVRQESNLEPHTCNDGCGVEHFPHTRAALRAFVANDDDMTFLDFTARNGLDGCFFRIVAFWLFLHKSEALFPQRFP